jgi:septal ring factor EnvC (AmiA/AmiB activator)
MEGQSSRLKQAEDRIQELEDEMVIKGKTEELLVKQLKTCEKKIREFTDSIKRSNLRIMGIKKEEAKAKGMHNIFNKIITKFPKSRERYSHTDARGLQNTKETKSK